MSGRVKRQIPKRPNHTNPQKLRVPQVREVASTDELTWDIYCVLWLLFPSSSTTFNKFHSGCPRFAKSLQPTS